LPLSSRFTIHQQLSLNLNGWQTIPDICLYPKGVLKVDWDSDEDEVDIPPLLVIEILSPKQNLQPLVDKIREYLRQAVKSCWLVEPATEVVTIFNAAGKRAHTSGVMRDEAVGVEISLPELFA